MEVMLCAGVFIYNLWALKDFCLPCCHSRLRIFYLGIFVVWQRWLLYTSLKGSHENSFKLVDIVNLIHIVEN